MTINEWFQCVQNIFNTFQVTPKISRGLQNMINTNSRTLLQYSPPSSPCPPPFVWWTTKRAFAPGQVGLVPWDITQKTGPGVKLVAPAQVIETDLPIIQNTVLLPPKNTIFFLPMSPARKSFLSSSPNCMAQTFGTRLCFEAGIVFSPASLIWNFRSSVSAILSWFDLMFRSLGVRTNMNTKRTRLHLVTPENDCMIDQQLHDPEWFSCGTNEALQFFKDGPKLRQKGVPRPFNNREITFLNAYFRSHYPFYGHEITGNVFSKTLKWIK